MEWKPSRKNQGQLILQVGITSALTRPEMTCLLSCPTCYLLHHPSCSLCWMIPIHMQKYALVPSILDSQANPPFPVYPESHFSALLCHETSFEIGALPLPRHLVACLPPAAWFLALSLRWMHSAVTSLVPEVRRLRCSPLVRPLGIIWTK